MGYIAKMLGVELDEVFEVIYVEGVEGDKVSIIGMMLFSENGLHRCSFTCQNMESEDVILSKLLRGVYTVNKLPWRPKNNDIVWFYSRIGSGEGAFSTYFNEGSLSNIALYKHGYYFRTKEEAEIKGRELYEKLLKEYREGTKISKCIDSVVL